MHALMIECQRGDDSARWVAERIAALMLVGDEAGAEGFRLIAAMVDQLRTGRRQ